MNAKYQALEIIAKVSGANSGTLTPELDLVADLGIDSPKALQLLVELEDSLEIEISDEDAAKLDSVGDILTYLEHLPAPPPV